MITNNITVKLAGGIGNQLFQYAFARYQQEQNPGSKILLDISFYNEGNQPKELIREYSLNEYSNINCLTINEAQAVEFNYFQDYRIPYSIRDILLYELSVDLPNSYSDLINNIVNSNSICFNVRRGDYVNFAQSAQFHKVIDNDFFNPACKIMDEKLNHEDKTYFIFSDDLDWCKKNFCNINNKHIFIEHNYAGPKFTHYLKLMSLCKHFIIPNSTFGWWGAFLSTNSSKKVILPKQWFYHAPTPNLLLPEWIVI